MLEHLGLVSALTELSTTFARVSGLHVERRFDPALPKLSPDAELAVYRIAQESLTNVARHAHATEVTIALERGPGSVVLSVSRRRPRFRAARRRSTAGCAACASGRSDRRRACGQAGRGGGVEVRLEVPAARRCRP